jgi:hypothetical protein
LGDPVGPYDGYHLFLGRHASRAVVLHWEALPKYWWWPHTVFWTLLGWF